MSGVNKAVELEQVTLGAGGDGNGTEASPNPPSMSRKLSHAASMSDVYAAEGAHPRVNNDLHWVKDTRIKATEQAPEEEEESRQKLGTLFGVFVPCLQNILGIILFLRLSWIVTQAGIQQTLIVVALCCATTSMTSLSLSAIATNGQIKGGGPYYLISRALGPEFGGAVGCTFFLGTTVAGSMYILGAVECLKLSIPQMTIYEPLDYQIFGLLILCCCTALVFGGVKIVSKVSPLFLIPVLLSVLGIVLGCLTAGARDLPAGITGITGDNISTNWTARYDPNNSFAAMLALFFPSVTGIMAGSNRSGDLKDPQMSIPTGTIGAVAVTSTLYLIMTFLYGAVAERSILNNRDVILSAEVAWPHNVMVRAGIVLSTLGAGLQSLTGAPRLLQAIANDNLIPILSRFRGTGEPKPALFLCFVICGCCILTGNIDFVAPIITMFFLLCYMFVNFSVLMQDVLKEPNWRPRFKYYHRSTAALGLLLCLFIMFYTNWYFALASILCAAGLFRYIEYRKVEAQWGDGMRGMKYQQARNALLELEELGGKMHTKNWRPQLLLFCKLTSNGRVQHPQFMSLLSQMKGGRGLCIIGTTVQGKLHEQAGKQRQLEKNLQRQRDEYGIKGFTQVVMCDEVNDGLSALLQTAGLGGLAPNTALVGWCDSWREKPETGTRLIHLLKQCHLYNLALILCKGISYWPAKATKLTHPIDLYWVVHDGGMLLMLASILRKDKVWEDCELRVFCILQANEDPDKLYDLVSKFLYNMRIRATIKCVQLEKEIGANRRLSKDGWENSLKLQPDMVPPNEIVGTEARTVGRHSDTPLSGVELERKHSVYPNQPVEKRSAPQQLDALEEEADMDHDAEVQAICEAFNDIMVKHSESSSLVMTNLPIPNEEEKPETYLNSIEVLLKEIPLGMVLCGLVTELCAPMDSSIPLLPILLLSILLLSIRLLPRSIWLSSLLFLYL